MKILTGNELKVKDEVWGPMRSYMGVISEIQKASDPFSKDFAIITDKTGKYFIAKEALDYLQKCEVSNQHVTIKGKIYDLNHFTEGWYAVRKSDYAFSVNIYDSQIALKYAIEHNIAEWKDL